MNTPMDTPKDTPMDTQKDTRMDTLLNRQTIEQTKSTVTNNLTDNIDTNKLLIDKQTKLLQLFIHSNNCNDFNCLYTQNCHTMKVCIYLFYYYCI